MGLIWTVFGARDAVGKTVFATNLALSLYRQSKKRILLMELDVHGGGDVRVLLNVRDAKSIGMVANQLPRVDARSVDEVITRLPQGISFLPLYQHATELARFELSHIDRCFRLLERVFDVILVDIGREFNPYTVRALEAASGVFFLVTPDIFVLNQSEDHLNHLRTLHISSEMVFIILNKAEQRGVIGPALVKQKLKKEPLLVIPRDDAVFAQSVQRAVPIMAEEGKDFIHRCYDELARHFLGGKMLAHFERIKAASGRAVGLDQFLPMVNPALATAFQARPAKEDIFSPKAEDGDQYVGLKERIHERLVELLELKETNVVEIEKDPVRFEALKQKTREKISQLLDEEAEMVKKREDKIRLAREIFNEVIGLGPLEDLIKDPSISEIMVNHRAQIYVEQGGKLKLTNLRFTSDKSLLGVIERIVGPIGRRIDEKTPMVDARLKDGSRVNAIIHPLSLKGPMLTIRKFFKEKITYKDLVRFGTLTAEIADFFRAAVEARLNIIVSGGTGTGKTTLLNIIGGFISSEERIITVEDAAELQLPQPHLGTLEARPPNLQGEGAITIRDLVRNTLRMRPDRIIVGECRGAEALDMLQAMNTGHDGSLTTIHANSPRDCLRRLETLVMFGGYDLPSQAIREQIASAIDLIIQLKRMSDGSRKVTHVTEVLGMEGDQITCQDIFLYKQTGVDAHGRCIGRFEATGLIPKFVEELKAKGIKLPQGIFGGVK